MKNYAKKIVLSVITSLLLSAGFAHAAQVVQSGVDSDFRQISDVGTEIQQMELPCARTGDN